MSHCYGWDLGMKARETAAAESPLAKLELQPPKRRSCSDGGLPLFGAALQWLTDKTG